MKWAMKVIMYFSWWSLVLMHRMHCQAENTAKITVWVFDVNEAKRAGMGNAQGYIMIVLNKADAADSTWSKTEP